VEHILNLLNQPFIIPLPTLLIGGYLFKRFAEHRARREKIREQAIQFLGEVGRDLNSVISLTFGHIRNGKLGSDVAPELYTRRARLFERRFTVRIKSKAFLKSDEFWRQYEELTMQINDIVLLMFKAPVDMAKKASERTDELGKRWRLGDVNLNEKLGEPFDELIEWNAIIFRRAVQILSGRLEAALK
jgi:hypothetical protein